MSRHFSRAERASFDEPEQEPEDDDDDFCELEERDEIITDAEASGLINDAIDRCFNATIGA